MKQPWSKRIPPDGAHAFVAPLVRFVLFPALLPQSLGAGVTTEDYRRPETLTGEARPGYAANELPFEEFRFEEGVQQLGFKIGEWARRCELKAYGCASQPVRRNVATSPNGRRPVMFHVEAGAATPVLTPPIPLLSYDSLRPVRSNRSPAAVSRKLAHGEIDEKVPLAATLQLVDALIRANKDFDLLILANRFHSQSADPYFLRKRWDYFVKHLLGQDPLQGFRIHFEGATDH